MAHLNEHEVTLEGDELTEMLRVANAAFADYFGMIPWSLRGVTATANVRQLREATGNRLPASIDGWTVTFVAVVDRLLVVV